MARPLTVAERRQVIVFALVVVARFAMPVSMPVFVAVPMIVFVNVPVFGNVPVLHENDLVMLSTAVVN